MPEILQDAQGMVEVPGISAALWDLLGVTTYTHKELTRPKGATMCTPYTCKRVKHNCYTCFQMFIRAEEEAKKILILKEATR